MTLHEIAPGIHQLDGATVHTMPSRTHPDTSHLIIHHDNSWHCTCPATVVECWHVHEVRKAINEQGPPLTTSEGQFDVTCEECGASVEYRFGAWICPTHRDRGHVVFTKRDLQRNAITKET